jgi:hypothetical protein
VIERRPRQGLRPLANNCHDSHESDEQAGDVVALQGEPEAIDQANPRMINGKSAFTTADG